MLYRISLIALLLFFTVNESGYAQFVNWPDREIRNLIRDFTDIYKRLDTAETFPDFQYPLSPADAAKETILGSKQVSPNDPILEKVTADSLKNFEKPTWYDTRLEISLASIIRQRIILEQYRFAHLHGAAIKKTIAKIKQSWDSTRWFLYEYKNHPRTKADIKAVEDKWTRKICCNYFKWYGDFLNLQNFITDLELINNQFKRLWEADYDVDSEFVQYMPKHAYANKASYYMVKNSNTGVSYVDMASDVEQCIADLEKLSAAVHGKIADTAGLAMTYTQNKMRWLSSLEHLQDSFTTSKTILEDSVRILRRKQNRYQRESDSISVLLGKKRIEKDSLTNALRVLSEKLADSTSYELFLTKSRRTYYDQRDSIYRRCGDPNCRDSTVIADLKVVNKKIAGLNDKLDIIGNNIEKMHDRKRQFNTSIAETNALLNQLRQSNSEVSANLLQATNEYTTTEKAFHPLIRDYNYYLNWVETMSEYSEAFFKLNYDK